MTGVTGVTGAVPGLVDLAALAARDRDHDDKPLTARTTASLVRHFANERYAYLHPGTRTIVPGRFGCDLLRLRYVGRLKRGADAHRPLVLDEAAH